MKRSHSAVYGAAAEEDEICGLRHEMKMRMFMAAAIYLVAAAGCGTGPNPCEQQIARAQPITLQGAPNLHKVSDDLYRSAQPTARGMQNLKKMGIRTIINLRSFHSDRDEIGDTDLGYEHIYMKAWHPERKEAIRFLEIVIDPKRTPVLVHCQHGSDRTGALCALYRIAVQGWTREEAVREMTQGGFGFHEIWLNLPNWIRELDIEKIKKEAGIHRP